MSEQTEIMSLHVQDAFSRQTTTRTVLHAVKQHRPTVAVFAEAYAEGQEQLVDDVAAQFTEQGYAVVHGLYQDDDGRADRHGLMGIVRNQHLTDRQPHMLSLGSRNALYLPLADPHTGETIDVYGVHFDDRNKTRRLGQAVTLLEAMDPERPAIAAGKFNAWYGGDVRARVLRAMGPAVRRLPAIEPGTPALAPDAAITQRLAYLVRRFGSLSQRSAEMADGHTMQAFVDAGFADADPKHRPTKGPFNLDHIIYRGLERQIHLTQNKALLKDQHFISAVL